MTNEKQPIEDLLYDGGHGFVNAVIELEKRINERLDKLDEGIKLLERRIEQVSQQLNDLAP